MIGYPIHMIDLSGNPKTLVIWEDGQRTFLNNTLEHYEEISSTPADAWKPSISTDNIHSQSEFRRTSSS